MKTYVVMTCMCVNLILLYQQGFAVESGLPELIFITSEKWLLGTERCNRLTGNITIKNQKNTIEKTEPGGIDAMTLKLTGYAQVRYRQGDDGNDSFDIRRARITLNSQMSKQLHFKLQTELGSSRQKLLDAEFILDLNPVIQLSAGQFKIPFSRENLMSSSKLETINRSQSVEALTARGEDVLGNQNGRDMGIKLSGSFRRGNDRVLLDYAFGLCNGSGINTSDLNAHKDLVGRFVFHPLNNMTFGGSYYTGRYTLPDALDKTEKRERVGAEFVFKYSLVSVIAEYIEGNDGAIERAGGYAQVACVIIPQKLQGVLKYDIFDSNLNVSHNSSTIYTIGLTVMFAEKSLIHINYELKDEQDTEGENNGLVIQLQSVF